jgi:hypothetical protein
MLNEKLLSKQYYLDKLSLFIRNSYGVEEQVGIFWDLLTDINTSIRDLFDVLAFIKEEDADHTLDSLAEIVGCRRNLDVEFTYLGNPIKKTINLTNRELIRFIKTRIIRNNYSGNQIDFRDNYINIGLNVLSIDISPGFVQQVLDVKEDLNTDELNVSSNDKYMFLSGNYAIRSLGIVYEFALGELSLIGLWDRQDRRWNSSEWGA